jgi:hypothetical protein
MARKSRYDELRHTYDANHLAGMIVDMERSYDRQATKLSKLRAAIRGLPEQITSALESQGALEHDDTPEWTAALRKAIDTILKGTT